jgi:plastocyanin
LNNLETIETSGIDESARLVYPLDMKQFLATLSVLALLGAGCATAPWTQTSAEPTQPTISPDAKTPEAAAPKPSAEKPAVVKPAVKKPAPAPVGPEVTIEDSAFAPQTMAIKAGDTVIWKNKSTKSHTVTSSGGFLLLNSGNIAPGKTFSHTFDSPGSYTYHCGIHEGMTGTIIVR